MEHRLNLRRVPPRLQGGDVAYSHSVRGFFRWPCTAGAPLHPHKRKTPRFNRGVLCSFLARFRRYRWHSKAEALWPVFVSRSAGSGFLCAVRRPGSVRRGPVEVHLKLPIEGMNSYHLYLTSSLQTSSITLAPAKGLSREPHSIIGKFDGGGGGG